MPPYLNGYRSIGTKHEAYTYVLLDSPERKEEIERAFSSIGREV